MYIVVKVTSLPPKAVPLLLAVLQAPYDFEEISANVFFPWIYHFEVDLDSHSRGISIVDGYLLDL